MNTDVFSTGRMTQDKIPDRYISKSVQPSYYTANEFRQVCQADLTRLFKKHGRI